jgi:hypothetical protein
VERVLRTHWEGKKSGWNEAKIQVKDQKNWRALCNTSKPLGRKESIPKEICNNAWTVQRKTDFSLFKNSL